jgi:hypothetical protein
MKRTEAIGLSHRILNIDAEVCARLRFADLQLAPLGSAACPTNGLAKRMGEVSTLEIGWPGQKRLLQMGGLCPAAGSD